MQPAEDMFMRGRDLYSDDGKKQLCTMIEEKLLELWRRPACQCVVIQKWIVRAQNHIVVAMFAPPAANDAMKSSRRILVIKESTVAPPGLEDAPPPRIMAMLEDGGPSPFKSRHRESNYVAVATKKSGGAREGGRPQKIHYCSHL